MTAPPNPRRVAVDALVRIERGGAYANLLVPKVLDGSGLAPRDRAFVTQLVYGTVRHQRACDWFIERYALGDLDDTVRAALRLGTFQLRFLGTPPHAAVSATVETVPRRARGLVNAVLRKIASAEDAWPSDAVRLSYPDWMLDQLSEDLGSAQALAALEAMNGAATTSERPDGYVQDLASQAVVTAVDPRRGERILDMCAAPGGKATGLAAAGAWVAAGDARLNRARLIQANAARGGSGAGVATFVADGRQPPFVAGSFDRVLVDAPCSGLGSLRRRPDARWRVDADAPKRLAVLQGELLTAAAPLVAPGGMLVYSVCTLTRVETVEVAAGFEATHGDWRPIDLHVDGWEPWGSGLLALPQADGSDGMALFAWRCPEGVGSSLDPSGGPG